MLLKVGNTLWRLHFHTREAESDEERLKRGQEPLRWNIETVCYAHSGQCILSAGPNKYCVNGAVGVAKCSKKDQFVRSVANRLALTRAIEDMAEPTRRAIWEAYWLRVRRPKETPAEFRRRLGTVGTVSQLAHSLHTSQAPDNIEGHAV